MQFLARSRSNLSNIQVKVAGNTDLDDGLLDPVGVDELDLPNRRVRRANILMLDFPCPDFNCAGHISSSLVRLALTKVAAWAGRVIARGPSVLAFHTSEAA